MVLISSLGKAQIQFQGVGGKIYVMHNNCVTIDAHVVTSGSRGGHYLSTDTYQGNAVLVCYINFVIGHITHTEQIYKDGLESVKGLCVVLP